MKPDTQPAQLSYFLQEDIFLLKADKDVYRNAAEPTVSAPTAKPEPEQPKQPVSIPATATATSTTATAPAASTPAVETPAIAFKYLGGNQKNFLVLAHYPAEEFMTEAHLTALTSTLGRINFALNDVAIVNLAKHPEKAWQDFRQFFNPKKLLILGTVAVPASTPQLHINQLHLGNSITALLTFSFDEMMSNNDNKKTFWNQVKNI